MRSKLFFMAFLSLVLFSTTDLFAQTSLYGYVEMYGQGGLSDSQPWVASDPLNLQRAIRGWESCTEASGTDRVYKAIYGGYYATSQASPNCSNILLSAGSQGLTGGYTEFVGSSEVATGSFVVDQDKNILVTLRDGKKLLIITDQLMAGILVVRKLD